MFIILKVRSTTLSDFIIMFLQLDSLCIRYLMVFIKALWALDTEIRLWISSRIEWINILNILINSILATRREPNDCVLKSEKLKKHFIK